MEKLKLLDVLISKYRWLDKEDPKVQLLEDIKEDLFRLQELDK